VEREETATCSQKRLLGFSDRKNERKQVLFQTSLNFWGEDGKSYLKDIAKMLKKREVNSEGKEANWRVII